MCLCGPERRTLKWCREPMMTTMAYSTARLRKHVCERRRSFAERALAPSLLRVSHGMIVA